MASAIDRTHLSDLYALANNENPAFIRTEWGFALAAAGLLRLTNVSEMGYQEPEVYAVNETGNLLVLYVLNDGKQERPDGS